MSLFPGYRAAARAEFRLCSRIFLRRPGMVLLWLLATLACIVVPAGAAIRDGDIGFRPPVSLRFGHLGTEQGLPQPSIYASVQDRDGYLWFGTQSGVARYDGYAFTVFNNRVEDPGSLGDNWIQALHVDREGRVWVGHRRGLDLYDPAGNRFVHHVPPGIGRSGSGDGVNAIVEDREGRLWIGTGDGLARFDPRTGAFEIHHHDPADPHSLRSERVFTLEFDRDGGLWIGTVAGIDYLADGATRFAHFRLQGAEQDPRRHVIRALLADPDGSVWVGTQGGLVRWQLRDGVVQELSSPTGSLATTGITSVYRDAVGIVWIGTQAEGLYRLQPDGQLVRYQHDRSDRTGLGEDFVISLLQDSDGVLWVGTMSSGASWVDLNSGGFERYGMSSAALPRLGGEKVYDIVGDGGKGVWLALLQYGLVHVEPGNGQVRSFRHDPQRPDSLSSNDVSQVELDARHGRLWVAAGNGLEVMDLASGRFRRVPLDPGISLSAAIYCLVASGDDLWVCSRAGLYRVDLRDERIRVYRHDAEDPHSIASDLAVAVLPDGADGLWVATFGGGLDHLDVSSGHFSHNNQDAGPGAISSNRVQTLMIDRDGTLWAGTSTGLNRAQRQPDGRLRFTAYSMRDGLPSDSIGGVLQDPAGQLWISTVSGLSRLDPASGTIRNYTLRDGLVESAYYIGSYYKAPDGRMYFGGVDGLSAFYPDDIRGNPVPPQTRITDLKVFNRSIKDHMPAGLVLDGTPDRPRRLQLPHELSVLSLEFSAMHAADAARNRYAYRLEGFDRDWSQTDATRRFATYTNLDPGRYVFHVRAANKDGLWEQDGERLEIVVLPPFWATWWFRIGTVVLVLLAASAIYLWRVRRLQRQARELERRVEERTVQLEQALAQLEQVSQTDPLTGAYNRRFLTRTMESEAVRILQQGEAGTGLLFLLLDIDHFKRLNDQRGHAAGDSLLRQVAARLRAVAGDDAWLVRWGGEEFLLAVHAPRADAGMLAERLRACFADAPFILDDGQPWPATCSIGAAAFPFLSAAPDALRWTEVIDIADIGLYAAKESGRNGWVLVEEADNTAAPEATIAALRTQPQALFAAGVLRFETGLDRAQVERRIGRLRQRGE